MLFSDAVAFESHALVSNSLLIPLRGASGNLVVHHAHLGWNCFYGLSWYSVGLNVCLLMCHPQWDARQWGSRDGQHSWRSLRGMNEGLDQQLCGNNKAKVVFLEDPSSVLATSWELTIVSNSSSMCKPLLAPHKMFLPSLPLCPPLLFNYNRFMPYISGKDGT